MRHQQNRGNYDVYQASAQSHRRASVQSSPVDVVKPINRPASHPRINRETLPRLRSNSSQPTRSNTAITPLRSHTPLPAKKKNKRVNWKSTALFAMATGLFLFGGVVSYKSWDTNKHVAAWVEERSHSEASDSISGSSDEEVPDESEPSGSSSSYRVASDLPRVLRIGELKINARIRPLGVDNKNKLRAPSNIFDVGWYDASAKPGAGGTTVLDGHVHGPTKPGIFYNLKKLKAGSRIEVERGDGETIVYEVVSSQKYAADQVDMAAVMTPAVVGKEALNLITCTGALDKKNNTYEDRLVVFAVRIN